MSGVLQQQLTKLDIPGPVQHYAIAAIFDAACQSGSSPPSAPSEAALQQCLCLRDGQAAGVAVHKLLEMTENNRLQQSTAQSLLLTALAVASPAAAVPLGSAAVSLWAIQLKSQASSSIGNSSSSSFFPSQTWKSHFLSKAVLASPSAGPAIVSTLCKLLTRTARPGSNGSKLDYVTVISAVQPFLCYIILDPTASTQHSQQLSSTLCSSLVRMAASLESSAPHAQHAMLRMLCSFLPALQVRTAQQQLAAEIFVADVMELLESSQQEPGKEEYMFYFVLKYRTCPIFFYFFFPPTNFHPIHYIFILRNCH